MTTKVEKRAIAPPSGDMRTTVQGLFVQVNELSGAIGSNQQRSVRVCELLDAGIITLDVDGALVKPAAPAGATSGLYVAKAGDTMTGILTNTAQDYLVSSRSGYVFSHFNFGNGQFGVYDQTAAAAAWKYNNAAGGVHDLRGAVYVTGNLGVGGYIQAGNGASGWKVAIGDDVVLADIGVAYAMSIQSQSNSAFGRLWLGMRQTFDNDGDGWLRINQGNSYANGIYTPGNFNCANLITGTVNAAGASFADGGSRVHTDVSVPRLGGAAAFITDWNNATSNGWYMASAAANAPNPSEWFMGNVTVHNGDWIQQEVWNFTAGADTTRYRRHKLSGAWGAWTANLTFGGVVTAVNFTATSDARLKTNITPDAPQLGLSTLSLHNWLWASSSAPGRGVIAQHVLQVAPEYVHTNADGMLSVDKAGLALELAFLALSQIRGLNDALALQPPECEQASRRAGV